MKFYFAYTRVSTVKQGERGSSLQEQKSAIEAYAQRQGLSITHWFEEMETAAKLGRRVFNGMLAELQASQAAGVIIHKIDRSARNLKDWACLGELIDRGVEVHFAHETLDLNSRGGRLSADIQAVVAADYIRNLRQEVRKGFYGRLKQGFYPLPAPIGYLNRGKAKFKEIDPQNGPLVRTMFELCAAGRYSLELLRFEMHRRGLSGPTGHVLSKNGIARTLHNPFYMGIIRVERTGEIFQGGHEPLITKATFDRAQAALRGRTFPYLVKHGHTYRRLIQCSQCRSSLVGERQKGHVYYRCHSRECRGTCVREVDLEHDLGDLLSLITFDDREMEELRRVAEAANAGHKEVAQARRNDRQRALALCEDRHTRLTDAFLDGTIDRETFESRKEALFQERAGLRDALSRPDDEPIATTLLKKLELGNMAQSLFNSPISDEKRQTVEFVTSNLSVTRKNLEITLQFPFDEIAKRRPVLCGAPCWTRPRTPSELKGEMDDVTHPSNMSDLFHALLALMPTKDGNSTST